MRLKQELLVQQGPPERLRVQQQAQVLQREPELLLSYRRQRGQRQQSLRPKREICSCLKTN
jgi:hypothetical protein